MWSDTLLIVFISVCTAFLGEGQYRLIKKYMDLNLFVALLFRVDMAACLSYRKISKVKDRSGETK